MSVLSVADTDCRLIDIGNVAHATGGHVMSHFLTVFTKYCLITFTPAFLFCEAQYAVGSEFTTMTIDFDDYCDDTSSL